MKRHHLTGNRDILTKWWREQLKFSNLVDDQFDTLIRASFDKALSDP